MLSRRNFVQNFIKLCMGVWLGMGGLAQTAWASAKRRLLPKGTDPKNLINNTPKNLDTSLLEITPIEEFGTMGESDRKEDIKLWQLAVSGKVERPLSLDYAQVTSLPKVERKELLICPGVFSYHALYQGVMLGELLKRAGLKAGAEKVIISGPMGEWDKEETFSLGEIEAGRVFLAWAVNGKTLPVKHGYPLRVVAPDRYGDDWVKYVAKLEVV